MRACDPTVRRRRANAVAFTHFLLDTGTCTVTVTQLCVVDTGTRRWDIRPLQPAILEVVRMKKFIFWILKFEIGFKDPGSGPRETNDYIFVDYSKMEYLLTLQSSTSLFFLIKVWHRYIAATLEFGKLRWKFDSMILHLSHCWLPVAAEFALNKMNCIVVIIQMFIFLIAGRFAAHCKKKIQMTVVYVLQGSQLS